MLTEAEIKQFIDEDALSDKKRFAQIGERYYNGEHDILKYRLFYYNGDGVLVEDTTRANNRICHPFFTELVDQLASYMLSFEGNPIRAKDTADGLQEHLDVYFDDDFWAEMQELIVGTNSKGFEYMYAFKNEDDRLAFECADSLGVVEVLAKYASDGQDHVLYSYVDRIEKGKKVIKRIQDHTKDEIQFYVQEDNGDIQLDPDALLNPRPNVVWTDPKTGVQYGKGLGFIPFWRLDNNKKQFSGLKPIKALIDDYDLMECGLSNNLEDFDTPIHVVKGYPGDDLTELQQNIKTKKIIGTDAGGDIDIKTINVPYEARKTKADEDEKNIYRFGMGFNSSQVGDGNITNIVIKSRYTLLDLKAGKLGMRVKRFLKPIIKVVLEEINAANGTDYQPSDVKVELEYIVPTNQQENAQIALTEAQTEQVRINTILNVAMAIGDEEALKAICDILDLDFDDLKDRMAQSPVAELGTAQMALEGVVTDEPAAEIGTEAIPE